MKTRSAPGALPAGVVFGTLALFGCSIDARQGEVGIYENVSETGAASLDLVIRDFKVYDANDPTTNPDFHNVNCERDVAAAVLGSDNKPVYQTPTNSLPTFGKKYFDQWYRDVPDTNVAVSFPLPLTLDADGLYEYDSRKSGTVDTSTGSSRLVFLPIDDGTPYATAFGNQGSPHNYGFTGELHAVFTYPGQGSLQVRADDDLYVFIAGSLVVNLGGIHGADSEKLDVSALGLTTGEDYALDLFYAERAGKTGDLLIATSLLLRP